MSLESPDQDHFECRIYRTCACAVLATFTVLLHPQVYTNVKIPLKEHAIAQHVVNQTAHIVAHWKALININYCAAYMGLLYPHFVARLQYLCKCGISVPCKECLITLHILDIIIQIICHQKALINTYMCAAYTGLMYQQFWLHLHNLCICSLAYIICTTYTILLYPHFCVI